jgi:hypothetical protein
MDIFVIGYNISPKQHIWYNDASNRAHRVHCRNFPVVVGDIGKLQYYRTPRRVAKLQRVTCGYVRYEPRRGLERELWYDDISGEA